MDRTNNEGRFEGVPIMRSLGTLLLAVVLSGCGDWFEGSESPPEKPGQTIARVNDQEITKYELEAELKRQGAIDPDNRPEIVRDVLRRMIRRTVLAQKAEAMELDRTPEVMTELRRARAEILAQAYLAERLSRQLPISRFDVSDFIESHPHHFIERKHYIFDQILIGNDQMTDEVVEAIRDLDTLEAVEAELKKRNIEFSRRLNANLGSQFSREIVRQIDKLERDQIFLIRTRGNAIVSRIVEWRLQPVAGEAARRMAKRQLLSKRNSAVSQKIIGDLVALARIDFLGEFSDMRMNPDAPDEKETAAADEKEGPAKEADDQPEAESEPNVKNETEGTSEPGPEAEPESQSTPQDTPEPESGRQSDDG